MQNKNKNNRDYDFEKFIFEMVDIIAKTISKLEKIVIEYYSDSDKSEQLSIRQKKRLKALKNKANKIDEVIFIRNSNEDEEEELK